MPHTLQIEDGKLYAYGDNGYGQLGLGHRNEVVGKFLVLTNTQSDSIPWIKATAGRYHSAAFKKDGSLWVWGDNRFGQLAQDPGIQFSEKPIRLEAPSLNTSQDIFITSGYYFTIFYQYLSNGYGFGEFQNIDTNDVSQYREIVPLSVGTTRNRWVSISTGPKTIVGMSVSSGYKYTDWSGDLFSSNYARFKNLKIGDIFTLYDPGNRDRVLYKKVRLYSKGRGCCKINALCLHRMYRELVSNLPPNIRLNNMDISIYDMLDPEIRSEYAKPMLTIREKYGTDFAFNSAIARHSAMSKYKGLDPWTLYILFTITDTDNALDLMLYDSLYFSDDPNDTLNKETLVQIISATEIYNHYSDIDIPPYLLEKSDYIIKPSSYVLGNDYYNITSYRDNYFYENYDMNKRKVFTVPFSYTSRNGNSNQMKYVYLYKKNKTNKPLRFVFTSRYGYGIPVYRNKLGELTDFDYAELDTDNTKIFYGNNKKQGLLGCPYNGSPKYIRELEKDDTIYNQELLTHIVDLPLGNSGDIIAINKIINSPYLIRLSMEESGSSFKQAFMDPVQRIKTIYNGNINTVLENPGNDPMMFYIAVPDPNYTGIAVKPPTITVFYIGELTSKLITLLLDESTPAREVHDNFGISKADLSELWYYVQNAKYPYTNKEKQAFARLSALFYNKLKDQPLIDESAVTVLRTGISTNSLDQFYDVSTLGKMWFLSRGGWGYSYNESNVNIPYLGANCWTDREDRSKIIIFGNHIDSFKTGKTLIGYETWSGDDKKTRGGNDVITYPPNSPPVVAKDAYQEHITTVEIVGILYDPSEYRTILQLTNPFLNNYLMGNLLFGTDPTYQAMPFIYYNSIAPITEKLQNIPGPLK